METHHIVFQAMRGLRCHKLKCKFQFEVNQFPFCNNILQFSQMNTNVRDLDAINISKYKAMSLCH